MRKFSIIKPLFAALVLNVCGCLTSSATQIEFRSGIDRVALLELYTSEGCSSCPPAETWFTGLTSSPRLWKDFVPVAFHVDYWDSLGWKDAWGNEAFSERQRTYAQSWHNENIYTPGFVLNGKEWRNWFAGKNGPSSSHEPAGMLAVTSDDTNHWQVIFTPEKEGESHLEIHAALLVGGIDSDVKAGENRGRQLHHDFVAVDLLQIGMTSSNGISRGKFIINPVTSQTCKSLALTVWVTRPGELVPLQATGGWLISPVK